MLALHLVLLVAIVTNLFKHNKLNSFNESHAKNDFIKVSCVNSKKITTKFIFILEFKALSNDSAILIYEN